ncbi:hypothetical protein OSJ77_19605 [Phyllobacterium sp. 0TCS1.6C]|uniref:hypothetical protein n=1 Tax=unclassified Phyllobacterium TaxID=2638441 RepID=UPI0022656C54|nr:MULTISPECIES: hypothetical protein [unclassified Phyllobacterium]MCX8282404.1 hypothetical protein [Phyllobacterium sp. 0TCS1.6C]MCX8295243.1 hypothetical protein [Phyllobacterium sp. 0TCS1.6A]
MKRYLIIFSLAAYGMSTLPSHSFPGHLRSLPNGQRESRSINVDEKWFDPLPRDSSIPASPKMTEEIVRKTMDAELKARFDTAADPSTGQLTKQRANDFSWGFIADHFEEIDRRGNGFVSFGEVKDFMDARSPLRKKAAETVQIVE